MRSRGGGGVVTGHTPPPSHFRTTLGGGGGLGLGEGGQTGRGGGLPDPNICGFK